MSKYKWINEEPEYSVGQRYMDHAGYNANYPEPKKVKKVKVEKSTPERLDDIERDIENLTKLVKKLLKEKQDKPIYGHDRISPYDLSQGLKRKK